MDWIVERDLEVWQEIERHIDRRRIDEHDASPLGDFGTFRYNREALLGPIGCLAHQAVGGYNRDAEARKIANEIQGTFATTALAEVGAVGLGTLLATLITGAAADVTASSWPRFWRCAGST